MIKIKMSELLNCTEPLQKLASKELKARLALQIARLLKEAEKEIQNFNDVRMNLINKYGEKDAEGQLLTDDKGNCKILPSDISTFTKELNELVETEVEINANKLNLDTLDNLDFTPSDMAVLEPFIDMEEE